MQAKKTSAVRVDARTAARIEYHAAPLDALFAADVVAVVTGNTPRTLEGWRRIGRGPSYQRVGRSVRYRKRDVELWLAREGVTQ